jgi:hypothetical protein
MTEGMRDPTPAEIHQVEGEATPDVEVPVRVEGPVDVRSLPAVAWAATRYEVTDQTGPVKASSRNPFRKRILLHSETSGFFYGPSQGAVAGRAGAPFIAPNVVVELTHTEEIWIQNKAAESPLVSVSEEMWSN